MEHAYFRQCSLCLAISVPNLDSLQWECTLCFHVDSLVSPHERAYLTELYQREEEEQRQKRHVLDANENAELCTGGTARCPDCPGHPELLHDAVQGMTCVECGLIVDGTVFVSQEWRNHAYDDNDGATDRSRVGDPHSQSQKQTQGVNATVIASGSGRALQCSQAHVNAPHRTKLHDEAGAIWTAISRLRMPDEVGRLAADMYRDFNTSHERKRLDETRAQLQAACVYIACCDLPSGYRDILRIAIEFGVGVFDVASSAGQLRRELGAAAAANRTSYANALLQNVTAANSLHSTIDAALGRMPDALKGAPQLLKNVVLTLFESVGGHQMDGQQDTINKTMIVLGCELLAPALRLSKADITRVRNTVGFTTTVARKKRQIEEKMHMDGNALLKTVNAAVDAAVENWMRVKNCPMAKYGRRR